MEVVERIKSTLSAHPIVLFMKGTPQMIVPQIDSSGFFIVFPLYRSDLGRERILARASDPSYG